MAKQNNLPHYYQSDKAPTEIGAEPTDNNHGEILALSMAEELITHEVPRILLIDSTIGSWGNLEFYGKNLDLKLNSFFL